MCQKAPKCADFLINPGGACPRPHYPRLAPTELAFMHSVNQNTHINSQTRCYDPEYRLELFFRCVKVCQVHNDPPRPSMASRLLRSHENISCFKYCPPPPQHGILDAPLRFYRYSVKHLGSRSGSTFCLVWSGSNLLAKIIILRASPLVSYRILGRGYCSTSLFAENK